MAAPRAHTDAEIKIFMEELKKQTDRGVGIVAAAVIEDALEFAIKRRLVVLSNTRAEELFGRMRPLSSLSAKIELGFALGLYDDNLRKPLNMLRGVRNEFAHNMEATSFDFPEIAKLINAARSSFVPKDKSLRETFLLIFYAALMLLYTEGSADTRIKPLGETHPDLFVQLALAVQVYQQTLASVSTELLQNPDLRESKREPPDQK
jgi:hypothetical protein